MGMQKEQSRAELRPLTNQPPCTDAWCVHSPGTGPAGGRSSRAAGRRPKGRGTAAVRAPAPTATATPCLRSPPPPPAPFIPWLALGARGWGHNTHTLIRKHTIAPPCPLVRRCAQNANLQPGRNESGENAPRRSHISLKRFSDFCSDLDGSFPHSGVI